MVRFRLKLSSPTNRWDYRLNSTMVRFRFVVDGELAILLNKSQFHYGSIQIYPCLPDKYIFECLNSTMVRFRFYSIICFRQSFLVSIPLWFDSDRSPTYFVPPRILSQFHYGSIQMYHLKPLPLVHCRVSIPLWFDSDRENEIL